MSKIKEFFKDLFAKCASFFKKCTSTKKGNVIFMVVELVLVLAIAGGSIAGVAISAMNSHGKEVTSSTVTVSSDTGSEVTLTSSSDGETVSSEEVSLPEEPATVDPYVPAPSEPQYTTTKTIVPTSEAPLTQWSQDRILPSLPEAASVLDYFDMSKLSGEELLMFTSLKGIVNKVQPRIYTCDTDPSAAYNNWIDKLDLKFNKVENPYTLIDKYKNELAGIVIYDDKDKMTASTINLATTIAGTRSALIVSPALAKVIQKKYNFKVVEDLRKPLYTEGHRPFNDKWEIYEYMYDHYLTGTSDRVICGVDPETVKGYIRDYCIAIGANMIWLDPEANADAELLNQYLNYLQPGNSVYMGWWLQENAGVRYASERGVVTLAADWSQNLSVYAGMNKGQDIKPQKTVKAPKLKNKIYVSYIMSDGDNIQYCEGFMQGIWAQAERGDFPIAWTVTPSMYDIAKPLLKYYYKTATDNDCFISGPSGYGYFYPKYFYLHEDIAKTFPRFLQKTDKYFRKLGWRAITVWNDQLGALDKNQSKIYADNMPYLLGISQQENMDKPRYLINNNFISTSLSGAQYCSELYQFEQKCKNSIDEYYNKGATEPMFIPLQAQNWTLGANLANLAKVKKKVEDMAGADCEFVRFDVMLQLMAQYEKSKK